MRWSIKKIKIKDLKPFVDNPRVISDKELKKLVESLKNQGNFKPLIVNQDLTILGGNQRYQALKAMGVTEVEVSIPEELLSKEEAKRIVLLDNTHSGEFDLNMLAEEFEDAIKELDLGIELPSIEPEVKEDDFEEPEEKNIHSVQKGDIWQLGEHRLMCGDATSIDEVERLMDGNKADMVFTDPPYNTKLQQGRSSKQWGIIKNDNMRDTDFAVFCKSFVNNLYMVTDGDKYICMGWSAYNILFEAMPSVKNCIVWVKDNFGLGHNYRPQHEFILYDGGTLESNSESNVWNESKDASVKYKHPTQKPIAIPSRAIRNSSKRGDVILDLFGGSGSTLIACEQLNRKCYMMELDEHYCSVIIERWQNLTNKKAKKLN